MRDDILDAKVKDPLSLACNNKGEIRRISIRLLP